MGEIILQERHETRRIPIWAEGANLSL